MRILAEESLEISREIIFSAFSNYVINKILSKLLFFFVES